MEFKYFGEFGLFYGFILGEIEIYCKEHPENYGKITLYTYETLKTIINLVIPNYFKYVTFKTLSPKRCGFNDNIYDIKYDNIPVIVDMFDVKVEMDPYIFYRGPERFDYSKRKFISKKLEVKNDNLINLMNSYDKVVVFYFRNRDPSIQVERNYVITAELVEYFKQYFNSNNVLCAICNWNSECDIPSFINTTNSNIYLIKTIEDSICIFNKCDEFITYHSGIEDLAKFSGCKKLSVIKPYNVNIVNTTFDNNPFNTEIQVLVI